MRQILFFIAWFVLAVVPMRAEEDGHYWVDDILYTINDDSTTVTVISCSDDMESLIIPSTVDINGVNYRVTDIGAWAFERNWDLRYVDTGDGVERIGVRAFYSMSHLDSIAIGKSVKSIGVDAFDYGHHQKVIIRDLAAWCNIDFANFRANPLLLKKKLILNGEEITDLVIPEGITEIKNNAFAGGAFTSVTIPEGVIRIGDHAFYDCYSLNTPLVLPNSLTTIEESAFDDCYALPEVYFGDNIASIGNYAFDHCPLTKIHITDLAKWCGIEFRTNQISTAGHLFIDGEEIVDLVIPDGVEVVNNYAFNSFVGFQSVTIPPSVTTLGSYVFSGCNNVRHLIWNSRHCNFNGSLPTQNITQVTLGDEVEMLPPRFLKGAAITSLVLPNSLQEISANAFDGCVSLTEITFNDSLKVINYGAFYNCARLKSVVLPDGVTTVHDRAFAYCDQLQEFTIGKGMQSFHGRAYEGCPRLTHVILNAIDLKECHSPAAMKELTFGPGVKRVPDWMASQSSLQSVVIPNSVTVIGESAFRLCEKLTSVTLGDSTQEIGGNAFLFCRALEHISLPESITSIGGGAFYECNALKSITLPSRLTVINENLLNRCINLKEIIIPSGVKTIGYQAFCNCNRLRTVFLPDSLTEMRESAFYQCSNLTNLYSPLTDPHRCDIYDRLRFAGVNMNSCVLHVPIGTTAAYRAEKGWKDFVNIVEEVFPHHEGDINGDGEINIADINAVTDYIMTGNSWFEFFMDVNGDGEVNIADINAVINEILNN